MPPEAKLAVFDDSEVFQRIMKVQLEKAGHEVLLTAGTLSSALERVKLFSELEIDVVLVDGNYEDPAVTGKEGEALVEAIRKHSPNVLIVGVGALEVRGADINVVKSKIKSDIGELGNVVRELETPMKVR